MGDTTPTHRIGGGFGETSAADAGNGGCRSHRCRCELREPSDEGLGVGPTVAGKVRVDGIAQLENVLTNLGIVDPCHIDYAAENTRRRRRDRRVDTPTVAARCK
jgi:hypothetical protein